MFDFVLYRGKAIFDLIRLLICSPEIPEKMAAPSKSTQNLQATDEEVNPRGCQGDFSMNPSALVKCSCTRLKHTLFMKWSSTDMCCFMIIYQSIPIQYI